jgi:truncated hemoglobin YjbI
MDAVLDQCLKIERWKPREISMSNGTSYFDELGGTPTVKEAVDRFYRLVLGDGELAPYFTGIDLPQLKAHQVKLISHVLGGPNEYQGGIWPRHMAIWASPTRTTRRSART